MYKLLFYPKMLLIETGHYSIFDWLDYSQIVKMGWVLLSINICCGMTGKNRGSKDRIFAVKF